jgi:threonine/homoserine/homoserine lactone efflux protein
MSTSISHGTKRGLQTVLGTSSAMIIQLIIAALGTSWLVSSLTNGFEWLRLIGISYLIYLGINHFYKMIYFSKDKINNISAISSFGRGFITSLTNPKTLLFFSAFFPQFVIDETIYLQQITLLSITFLILATFIDSLYAFLACKLSRYFKMHHLQKLQHAISGTLFLTAAAWLTLIRRT